MIGLIDNNVSNIGYAKIVVVGVGGGGNNAVNRMIECGATDIDFIAINTDQQVLLKSKAPVTITIGEKSTRGLGAGGNPEVGKQAAEESKDEISQAISGADMVFITAGMGGGTGTGAAPIVAEIAKKQGILTVAIVTKPFIFEGKQRMRHALDGIEALKERVDTLVVVPNEKIFEIIEDDTTQREAYLKADEVLREGVVGIANIIRNNSDINLDFADVRTVMADKGYAHLGVGEGAGKNMIKDAIHAAIDSPLLETSIEGAKTVLVNIASGNNLSFKETTNAVQYIQSLLHEDAFVIHGSDPKEELQDKIIITIVATDLSEPECNEVVMPKAKTGIPQLSDSIVKDTPDREPQHDRGVNRFNTDALDKPEVNPVEEQPKAYQQSNVELSSDKLQIPNFLRRKK